MVQSFNRSLNSDSRSSLFGGLIITLILTLTIHQVMVNAAIGAGKRSSMLDTLKGNSFLRYSKVKSVLKSSSSSSSSSASDDTKQHLQRKDHFVKIREELPNEVLALVGSNHVLTCGVQASPSANIYWLKEGKKISQSHDDAVDHQVDPVGAMQLSTIKSHLYLNCVHPKDSGIYSCVAETPFSKAISHTQLTVISDDASESSDCLNNHDLELNSPKIFMWTSTRLERIGSSAVIFCRSNGHPKPTIKWLGPDDKPLIKSNKYQIMSNGDLYIKNIRWNDMGPYTCIAENRFGQDKTVAFLYPTKRNSSQSRASI